MKPQRYHLEIQRRKTGIYGLIRSSFRKNGKVAHKTVGFLSGLSLEQLQLIQATFQGRTISKDHPQAPRIIASREYGASHALLALAKQLEMDRLLYSRVGENWVKDVLAMIVGRVIFPGSKLSLAHRWKDTALWELCGQEQAVDVQRHCYEPMDRLLERQPAIQKALVQKHLKGKAPVVLYDITSSYLEGSYRGSQLVFFGYNRDRKRGHKQVVYGLVCNQQGCPVAVEVFAGNTRDSTTVKAKVQQLCQGYGVEQMVFVGDRGMITPEHFESLRKVEGLSLVGALTHREMKDLVDRGVLKRELFRENGVVEIKDPEVEGVRYCLCYNPESQYRETQTRDALMERTQEALDRLVGSKRKSLPQKIGERVGKILSKTKMGKLVEWNVEDGRLKWQWKSSKLLDEKTFDGCYVIRSTVDTTRMNHQQVVGTYKQLAQVEQAFRNIKTVSLQVRPIFHQYDHRIEAHIFLCMLSYYLQWHMQKRLEPLFATDGKEKDRFWTLENVIERLKSIRIQTLDMGGVPCQVVSDPDPDQEKILKLLKISL